MTKLRVLSLTAAVLGLFGMADAAAVGPQAQVVGGQSTTVEEWPWQVAIASPPSGGGDGYDRQFCGGSLVSPTLVVTAAHCVYDGGFEPPSDLSVITGRTTLSSAQGAEIAPTEVIYFVDVGGTPTPQVQGSPPAGAQLYDNSEWDVAMLRLSAAAPPPAAPIKIAGAEQRSLWEAGDQAFITGWGNTNTSPGPPANYPDDMHEAEISIVSDSDCATAYPTKFSVETMVCAGIYPAGGKDTCQGDSGGPLVVPAADGSFRLVGDTSFGTGCALPNLAGVYGRIADDPMRSAIAAVDASVISSGPPPAPPAPNPPPSVTDTKKPLVRFDQTPKARTRKRKAKFTFSADEPASFKCKLDKAAYASCTSPYNAKVKRKRHTFAVRAIDASGNVSDPVSFSWKVNRKRK